MDEIFICLILVGALLLFYEIYKVVKNKGISALKES